MIRLTTPPIASVPYRLEELPFIISIFSIFPIDILSRSSVPDCLPIIGYPSTRRSVYSESKP